MSDELIFQALTRIESKVDSIPASLAIHGERIAKTEARLDAVESDQTKAEVKDWLRAGLTYVSVMASHLGLNKIGFKI